LEYVRSVAAAGLSGGPIPGFLDAHLLGWLPSLVHATRREMALEYADILDTVLGMVIELRRLEPPGFTPIAAEEIPDTLSDERAGVSDIARHLCTHAWTGLFVGRETIGRWARTVQSPRGFGGRALMLGNLLRSAASYDALEPLLDLIREEVVEARLFWRSQTRDAGSLGAWADHWETRLTSTEAFLDRLSTEALAG
jgi:hypothetical protein